MKYLLFWLVLFLGPYLRFCLSFCFSTVFFRCIFWEKRQGAYMLFAKTPFPLHHFSLTVYKSIFGIHNESISSMSASTARGDVPLETSAPVALRSPHGRSDEKKRSVISTVSRKKGLTPTFDLYKTIIDHSEPFWTSINKYLSLTMIHPHDDHSSTVNTLE